MWHIYIQQAVQTECVSAGRGYEHSQPIWHGAWLLEETELQRETQSLPDVFFSSADVDRDPKMSLGKHWANLIGSCKMFSLWHAEESFPFGYVDKSHFYVAEIFLLANMKKSLGSVIRLQLTDEVYHIHIEKESDHCSSKHAFFTKFHNSYILERPNPIKLK